MVRMIVAVRHIQSRRTRSKVGVGTIEFGLWVRWATISMGWGRQEEEEEFIQNRARARGAIPNEMGPAHHGGGGRLISFDQLNGRA